MPYIKRKDRVNIDLNIEGLTIHLQNPGDYNYAICQLMMDLIRNTTTNGKSGMCYNSLNAAIGVLECAKLELYRRVAAPYEDTKIAENGDVF